jgi:5-methylcytosine-specific restriction enzyme B
MSAGERQTAFEQAVLAQKGIRPSARVARNFGFSNSARIIESGLFACTNNLETYSRNLAKDPAQAIDQFVFLCVLTFPPHDEVYFAIVVDSDAARLNEGLVKLYNAGVAQNSGGKISNNVKFYITDEGELYFHNEGFRESLRDPPQSAPGDAEGRAKIDRILFSVWPPEASARRGLLAREFVGYLGQLVGRERVHEVLVWEHAAALSPAMQRMPSTIDIGEIESAVVAQGGHYPQGEVPQLHAALNFHAAKHFVILSGLSGTGKTQLAIKYARAVHGVTEKNAPDPLLFVCPTRPEWTDPSGLTGYYDVLSNRYIVPRFLEAVLVAIARPTSPVFVVLDEMNLARVEYYFSDVLSALETREELQLHSSSVPLEASTGTSIPAALPLPDNLFIIGTINVDETTNPVSDKVLDRAVVIETPDADVDGFLTSLAAREPDLKESASACKALLSEAQSLMKHHRTGFGYRVMEEVVRYHAFSAAKLKDTSDAALDRLMVQKVLVKLRGGERQRALLTGLAKTVEKLPQSKALIDRLISDLDEYGSFQASR